MALIAPACHRNPEEQLGPPTPAPVVAPLAPDVGPAPAPPLPVVPATPTIPAPPPVDVAKLRVWWTLPPAIVDRGLPGAWIRIDRGGPGAGRWELPGRVGPDGAVVRIPGGADLCRPACRLDVNATGPVTVEPVTRGVRAVGPELVATEAARGDLQVRLTAATPAELTGLTVVARGAVRRPGVTFTVVVPAGAVLLGTAPAPWELTTAGIHVAGPAGPLAVPLPEGALRIGLACDGLPGDLRVAVPESDVPPASAPPRRVVMLVIGGLRHDRIPETWARGGTVITGLAAPSTSRDENLRAALGRSAVAASAAGLETVLLSADRHLASGAVDLGFRRVIRRQPKDTEAADHVLGEAGRILRGLSGRGLLVVLLPEADPPHLYRRGVTQRFDPAPYHGELGLHLGMWRLNKVKKGMIRMTPRDEVRLRALYDTDVTFFFERLAQRLPCPPDTLCVLTSTHGYELMDHGSVHFGHSLHREAVELPLLVWGAGVPPGRGVTAPARLEDVLPAALAIAGVPVPADRVLVGAMRGLAPRHPTWTSTRHGADRMALRFLRWRLLRRGTLADRVYDVVADPTEQRPLEPPDPIVLSVLRDLTHVPAESAALLPQPPPPEPLPDKLSP